VPAEHAADLRAEVLDIMRIVGLGSVKLRQTRQYVAGGWVDALINSPNLLAMASRLVGGPATLHSPFTAVKGPGGGEFHWHQDNQYTRFDGPGINVWIALENMTPENGCLVIAPRSHVYGTLSQVPNPDGDRYHTIEKTPEYFLPVRMRAGDCVAFDRLTVHASLPNQTSAPRVAYAVQFFRNDVNALHEDGQWRSLKDYPRIDPRPVPEIRPE
jgi:2-oxoglutarate-dependent dioxygenase